VGLVSGAIVLGESLGVVDLVGFALILAGIGMASLVAPRGPVSAGVLERRRGG
jgi:drug/metabolite transporter (DMT)-like permease